MILGTMTKQPGEARRVTIDYATRFLADGETVDAVTLSCSPTTDTPLVATLVTDVPLTSLVMLISGGEDGEEYYMTASATTSLSQVVESEVVVAVEEVEA